MPVFLIALGGFIMLVNIFRHRSVIASARRLIVNKNNTLNTCYNVHHALMVFFFFGYITVLVSIMIGISLIGAIFTGVVFFFGSVFVYIGISVQSVLLASIKTENDRLMQKNQQLIQTENVTIFALAYQAEIRDSETGKHLERTAIYARLIAQKLAETTKFKDYITASYIDDLVKAAPLHDIGKVGIPDHILKKPGKLSNEEFEVMKLHCNYGARILETAEKKLEFESFLRVAIKIVASHHEKWDGTGYPRGLKENDIPVSARIIAIADVYDALRSVRCYKNAMPHKEAAMIIQKESGKHFDPDIVDAFLAMENEFKTISEEMAD